MEIFVWFADGGPAPVSGIPCVGMNPPAYECTFGDSTDACRRTVMKRLEELYAEYNSIFVDRPPAKGAGFSVVVSSRGDWCNQAPDIGGLAPLRCDDGPGSVSYAFQCGNDPEICAAIIAQEQAHTLGLAHTDSPTDLMYPTVSDGVHSFENKDNATVGSSCRPRQNSHDLLRERLGRWPGGVKPSILSAL